MTDPLRIDAWPIRPDDPDREHVPRTSGKDPARFLSDLTPAMSKALVRCYALTVPADNPASMGIKPATLHALVRHGLIEKTTDKDNTKVWRPTSHGHQVITTEEPHLLAAASDALYTTDDKKALFQEPEAISGQALQQISDTARETHTARAAGVDEKLLARRRLLEQQLDVLKQAAVSLGADVRNEARVIQRALDQIERKIRDQHDAIRKAA